VALGQTWQRTTRPHATLVVAHRGAWGIAAENTLAAFETAIALGADMIEFDVRRTGDGRLVVCHDPSRYGLPLAGVRHGALDGADGTPPRLEEVLALAHGRIALDIELKERGCVREVIELLERFGPTRCLLSSFHDDVVREAKDAAPALTTGLIVGTYRSVSELFPSSRLRRASADVLIVHDRLADAGVLRRTSLPCVVWTVNDPRRLERRLADPRIAGVITDVPELALKTRAALTARTELAAPY
jgi:glycerophosphoryl diester phosphodiesterase